jgi:hypothetical protein
MARKSQALNNANNKSCNSDKEELYDNVNKRNNVMSEAETNSPDND